VTDTRTGTGPESGGAGSGASSAPARPVDPPTLRLTVEPMDGLDGAALVGALMVDLDDRYAADGPADGDQPEVVDLHTVRAHQVVPPHGAFVVARLGDEAVGCGAVRVLRGGPPGVAEIKRMYTAPTARRRGVSRAILRRLEHEAAALGHHRVQLETGLRQPEAIALYEAEGYHRIPSYGQYEADELSVCFAKDLPATPTA
jgi:putative acetyltransferase